MFIARARLARLATAIFAFAFANTPFATIEAQLALGANSRGYVAANGQVIPGPCGSGLGFQTGATTVYAPANANIVCSGPGWSGQSISNASAGTVRTFGTVTAQPGFTGSRVVALTGSAFLDAWTITGGSPTQAVMTFQITGSTSSSALVNALASSSARFSVLWDTNQLPPGPPSGLIAPGQYSFSFAITPDMYTRQVFFSISLGGFTSVQSLDGNPFSGSATTDYANTVKLTDVDFLRDNGDGTVTDVSQQVRLQSASGFHYFSTVPEPNTLVLFVSGLLIVLLMRRRFARR